VRLKTPTPKCDYTERCRYCCTKYCTPVFFKFCVQNSRNSFKFCNLLLPLSYSIVRPEKYNWVRGETFYLNE